MKQFGFPKAVRLNTPQEYAYIFECPIRCVSAFFTVLARSNGQHQARLGVIVAKKYAKKAVVRNRIRRLIRENFRQRQKLLAGLDVIVLLRKSLFTSVSGRSTHAKHKQHSNKQFEKNEQLKQMDQILKKQWQEMVSLWKKSS